MIDLINNYRTGATENYKHRGLIPRAISHLFREISERPQFACTVRISYLEIYNEQIVDLLSTINGNDNGNSSVSDPTNLTVVEDRNGNSHVKGLTVQIANNEEEALNLLFEGETNRSIAEHQLNKSSTRSHCIFTLYVESRSRVESTEKVISSKLNLVDLAGSERISKTHTMGVSLKEAMYINKSLTFLEQVIIALSDKKRDHIPYRQSKLTHVLRDSLGGNCNTLMIANIWGEKEHIEETISTLRFATRMMCVTNSPEINVQFDPMALIKKYEREVQELKQELAMHDALSSRSHVQYEAYGENQRLELQKQVKAYLREEEPELEIVSLRHIRELFSQFKILYRMLEQEREDLMGAVKKMASNSGAAPYNGGLIGEKAAEGESENMRQFQEYDRDDCVGDSEMSGFSVGLAPSSSGAKKFGTNTANFANTKRKKTTSKPVAITASGHGDPYRSEHEDEDYDRQNDEHYSAMNSSLPPLPGHMKNQKSVVHRQGTNGQNTQQGTLNNASTGIGASGGLVISTSNRSDEFENYKRTKGADIFRILGENKNILKEKKRAAKDLVDSINNRRDHIDKIKQDIELRQRGQSVKGTDDIVIDEEEYTALEKLKVLKQQYRDGVEQLKQTRLDIGYCSKLVDQCRQKLMTDFEQWYEVAYGHQLNDIDAVSGQTDDVMDIGEKFDRLQLERMSQEDPDSLPFYNARKNTERRNQRIKQK